MPVTNIIPANKRSLARSDVIPFRQSSSNSKLKQPRAQKPEQQQISICTNRTCKKQGSLQIAKFVEDLDLQDLTVARTGCLAKCGNGPNMVLSPLNVTLSHINTVAKAVQVLREVGAIDVPDCLLKATELRLAGNDEARSGRLGKAADLYSRALEHDPPCGRHLLLSNRSGVLLSLGRVEEAVADADEAAKLAPAGFRTAFIRQVEAHGALHNYTAASQALERAVERDIGFAKTAEYKSLRSQLDRVPR